MKAIAVIGYILAAITVIMGLVASTSEPVPYSLFAGIGGGFVLILLSTIVLGLAQIRDILRGIAIRTVEPHRAT